MLIRESLVCIKTNSGINVWVKKQFLFLIFHIKQTKVIIMLITNLLEDKRKIRRAQTIVCKLTFFKCPMSTVVCPKMPRS